MYNFSKQFNVRVNLIQIKLDVNKIDYALSNRRNRLLLYEMFTTSLDLIILVKL